MFVNQNPRSDLRSTVSELEIICLEEEDFEQARILSNPVTPEEKQWQTYLNALALLSLERWFNERLSNVRIDQNLNSSVEKVCNFQVREFKIGIISVEHVLDELISFPKKKLVRPECLADFYIVAEVMEEVEEIIFRGAISQDKLLNYINNYCFPSSEIDYMIPLSQFEIQPNHLLFYCQFLQSELISKTSEVFSEQRSDSQELHFLSESLQSNVTASLGSNPLSTNSLLNNCTQISGWFQNIFESAWQPLEALVSSERSLAITTRCVSEEIQRGKLINLGMELNRRRFMMLVTVTAETDDKRRVLAQLHPTGNDEYLPSSVQLTLQSKTGKIYQEVTSRSCDNYIQLNPFKGKSGKKFSIEVSWNETRIREDFEL